MDPNSLALLMGSAGGAGAAAATYVEDVFQTWLYTGNSSTQTITNGIDLAGKGGMVWIKCRSSGALYKDPVTYNTTSTNPRGLATNSTAAYASYSATKDLYEFTGTGFSVGQENNYDVNSSGNTFASWTFRKQAKFFDVVTYTGTGANQTIAHSLGSTPGCIIVKRTDAAQDWVVYHRSLPTPDQSFILLNSTAAYDGGTYNRWGTSGNVSINSSNFSVGTADATNKNGGSFVAYLFAHDAGGFGDTGNDSVIKCGSYTGNGSATGPTVTLGWEPQWLLVKRTDSAGYSWFMHDNMRQMSLTDTAFVTAESSSAESLWGSALFNLSATGFQLNTSNPSFNGSGGTYIYIAIRRGPMKTPTDATKVFSAISATVSTGTVRTTNFPIDLQVLINPPSLTLASRFFYDRLRGVSTTDTAGGVRLDTTTTGAEASTPATRYFTNTGFTDASYINGSSGLWWNFRRAPGFFDVVAYTGTGSVRTVNHNLGVTPELMIIKRRSGTGTNWFVYNSTIGATKAVFLDSDYGPALQSSNYWNDTSPTSSVFTVGTDTGVNQSTGTFVAYLFASCPGVSKVGSYTGTGTTLSIDCGFTAGARFVMIKRTDSTGDWYVWNTARGIIANNDPYLLVNSTAAEVTNTDYIDPLNAGFQISSTAPAAINANGGTFIYLAVA